MPPHLLTPLMPPPLPSRKAPAPGATCSRTLIYWPAVASAALLSLFVLTGLLAWLAAHPGSHPSAPQALAAHALETKPTVPQETPLAPPPREETAAVPLTPVAAAEAPPSPPAKTKVPALAPTPVALVDRPAPAPSPSPSEPPAADEQKIDETAPSPDLSEPAPTAKQLLDAQAPAAEAPVCKAERYGTSVDFLNNPQLAARQARTQAKLVFLLHVSGNFEDNCFT